MAELKVKSKKYNDADVIEVENFQSETVDNLKGQDITVKTLKQSQPNWEANNIFDDISLAEGLVYTNKYSRFEEINGILYIVHIFSVENTTDNAINADIGKFITLPNEIASKIYDIDGYNATEAHSANIVSTQSMYGPSSELYSTKVFTLRNTNTANRIEYTNVNATSIPAHTKYNYSFRVFLTLL